MRAISQSINLLSPPQTVCDHRLMTEETRRVHPPLCVFVINHVLTIILIFSFPDECSLCQINLVCEQADTCRPESRSAATSIITKCPCGARPQLRASLGSFKDI